MTRSKVFGVLTAGFTCADRADRPHGNEDDHDDRDGHEEIVGIGVVIVVAVEVVVKAVSVRLLNSIELWA